jgi:two-component system response regulator AlgR
MIRTLIIDDEPPARARLRRLLEAFPECTVAGEAGSGTRALEMIEELEPDLLLLDISMPGMDGMALASTLRMLDNAPVVVFCTAWPDQALEAFDHDAVDYLVKPVRQERLGVALAKVARLLRPAEGAETQRQFLRSTVGGRTKLVELGDVICLLSEDKYTTVIYREGKAVINESLVELENKYPGQLLRVHRNALVATDAVRGLERQGAGSVHLLLDGTDFRPEVSRRRLAAVRKFLRGVE